MLYLEKNVVIRMETSLSSSLAVERDIAATNFVKYMCVRASGFGQAIYAWISK